jgi:hypothetical protein
MDNLNYNVTKYDYQMTYLCETSGEEIEEPEPEPVVEPEVEEEEGPNFSLSNSTVTWETCEKDKHCQNSYVCVLVLVGDGTGFSCANELFCQGSGTWIDTQNTTY